MIRYAVYALLVTASLALETTWFVSAGIGGAVPDPLVVLIMVVGLFHGPEEGAALGALIGLLEDIVTGAPLGLGMLADLCVGFAAGLGVRIIYMENVFLPVLGAAALSALRTIVLVGAAHLVGLLQPPLLEVLRVAILAACYNGLIAFPLYQGFRSLDRALVRFREESR